MNYSQDEHNYVYEAFHHLNIIDNSDYVTHLDANSSVNTSSHNISSWKRGNTETQALVPISHTHEKKDDQYAANQQQSTDITCLSPTMLLNLERNILDILNEYPRLKTIRRPVFSRQRQVSSCIIIGKYRSKKVHSAPSSPLSRSRKIVLSPNLISKSINKPSTTHFNQRCKQERQQLHNIRRSQPSIIVSSCCDRCNENHNSEEECKNNQIATTTTFQNMTNDVTPFQWSNCVFTFDTSPTFTRPRSNSAGRIVSLDEDSLTSRFDKLSTQQ